MAIVMREKMLADKQYSRDSHRIAGDHYGTGKAKTIAARKFRRQYRMLTDDIAAGKLDPDNFNPPARPWEVSGFFW